MLVDDRVEALDKLAEVAALAGIAMAMNQRAMRLEGEFVFDDGRSQICYARPSGMVADKFVVTLFSPALRVRKGFLAGMTKEMALDLLRRNETTTFARYGLMDEGDTEMVVASADYLLDSLDPAEFEHAIWQVAMAADAYEREKSGGRDEF